MDLPHRRRSRIVGKGLDERAEWTSYLEAEGFATIRQWPEMQPVLERARRLWAK